MITIKSKEQVAAEDAATDHAWETTEELMQLCVIDMVKTEEAAEAKHSTELAAAKAAVAAIGKEYNFEHALMCWKARKQLEDQIEKARNTTEKSQ